MALFPLKMMAIWGKEEKKKEKPDKIKRDALELKEKEEEEATRRTRFCPNRDIRTVQVLQLYNSNQQH